jgi:nucleoside-diphosphate-sugar epimerase
MDPAGFAGGRAVVVLGAAGFVGRAVCDALCAAGRPVVAFVRRAPQRPLPPGCRVVPLDLMRSDPRALALELAAARPAAVVNTAGALWNVTDEQLTEGNVRLVERLVAALRSVPGPVRLVHLGSAYEYGTQPTGLPLTETLACHPAGRYASTKLAGTRLIARSVAAGHLDAVVLRIAVATGPHAPPGSLLGGIARQLAGDRAELRLPPIDGVRDIVDIRDVAAAVLGAVRADWVPPVVNVGSGAGVRLTDAVDELIRIAAPHPAKTVVRGPAPATRRDAGVGGQPLDIGRAGRLLGWAPERSLADALHGLWDSVRAVPPPSSTTLAVDGESIHV